MKPNHLAIIPDGNRRWAKKRGETASVGHSKGIERFHEISKKCHDGGINFLTFWAASEDNLTKREAGEVKFLTSAAKQEARRWLNEKPSNGSASFIGRGAELLRDDELAELIKQLNSKRKISDERLITILFGYDGRTEMLEAVKKLAKSGDEISAENLKRHLWTGHLPPVDLVIRTGGEPHWSAGFMMWHTADSQFYFTDTLWPDFTVSELERALNEFEKRERRLGA